MANDEGENRMHVCQSSQHLFALCIHNVSHNKSRMPERFLHITACNSRNLDTKPGFR